MSKTVGVDWLGGFFWAYDVSLAIVIGQFLDVAVEEGHQLGGEQRYGLGCAAFLGAERGLDVERDLVGNLPVDEAVRLLRLTAIRLRERGIITAAEAAAWRVLDDETMLWRGGDEDTEPAARLAELLIDAVLDRLPEAPDGESWFFGWPVPGKATIGTRPQWHTLHREAVRLLENWPPTHEAESSFWDTLELLEDGPQVMDPAEGGAHLTVGAVILSPDRCRALLCQDPASGRWFHPAGHCSDRDWVLSEPARRQAKDRTGIARLRIDPAPIHVSVREEGCGGRPNRHHEVGFVVYAPPGVVELVSDESCRLAWHPIDDLPESAQPGLHTLVQAAVDRAHAAGER